ncbi:unnamed protein product, partial [Plutella xylostella]
RRDEELHVGPVLDVVRGRPLGEPDGVQGDGRLRELLHGQLDLQTSHEASIRVVQRTDRVVVPHAVHLQSRHGEGAGPLHEAPALRDDHQLLAGNVDEVLRVHQGETPFH